MSGGTHVLRRRRDLRHLVVTKPFEHAAILSQIMSGIKRLTEPIASHTLARLLARGRFIAAAVAGRQREDKQKAVEDHTTQEYDPWRDRANPHTRQQIGQGCGG